MSIEIPVFAHRAMPISSSTQRKMAMSACWRGAAVGPNHSSLVMLTSQRAPSTA